MQTRGVRVDYNVDSHTFGQKIGPQLTMEWNFDDNKWIADQYYRWPVEISWPYVGLGGKWNGRFVVDVKYYALNTSYVESLEALLNQNSLYHNQLKSHLFANASESDKHDLELLETINSWQVDSTHDIKQGDFVAVDINGEKHFFVAVIVKDANIRDFEFVIENIKDVGLYKLDLTQSDLTNEQQIMQMNEASLQWVSHYKCDVIDLALHENATMRIAFGHLKYYVANSKLLDMAAANDINAGRLASIRNQTLQQIGRKYQRKLNGDAKADARFRAASFCPATAYVRCIVPYFVDECNLKYNFLGNNRNVRIKLGCVDVCVMLQDWATNKIAGDEEKGETDVTYFGRNIIYTYSFVTNQLALKFGVTDDQEAKKAAKKNKKAVSKKSGQTKDKK